MYPGFGSTFIGLIILTAFGVAKIWHTGSSCLVYLSNVIFHPVLVYPMCSGLPPIRGAVLIVLSVFLSLSVGEIRNAISS